MVNNIQKIFEDKIVIFENGIYKCVCGSIFKSRHTIHNHIKNKTHTEFMKTYSPREVIDLDDEEEVKEQVIPPPLEVYVAEEVKEQIIPPLVFEDDFEDDPEDDFEDKEEDKEDEKDDLPLTHLVYNKYKFNTLEEMYVKLLTDKVYQELVKYHKDDVLQEYKRLGGKYFITMTKIIFFITIGKVKSQVKIEL